MRGERKKLAGLFTVILCLTILTSALLTGCGASKPGQKTGTQGENTSANAQKERKDFKVILDWYPNAIHTFMYVAQEKGYFEEEGLNVELVPPAGVTDPIAFPAAGKAEAGMYYTDETIAAYADEGMNVEVLGAVTQGNLACVIALKEKHVTSPKDFKGKKIGYSGSEASRQMVLAGAQNCGLTEDDFELVDVGFDIETSVISGNVDAAFGGMLNNQVVAMQNAGYEIDYWVLEDYGLPKKSEIIFVVNKDAFASDPTPYQGFLNACRKGFADVLADPEASLDVLFNHEDSENYALDRQVEQQSLEILMNMEKNSGETFLSMKEETWDENIRWMLDKNLIKNEVSAGDFVYVEK